MLTLFFVVIASCVALALPVGAQSVVVDFEELSVFTGTPPSGTGQFFNGYGDGASSAGFESGTVSFETAPFGPGFSYSNVNNTTTPGFQNFFAAFPGGGSAGDGSAVIGSNYGLVASGSGATETGGPDNGATMTFAAPSQLTSIDIANTTYVARYALDGLDGFGAIDFDEMAQFSDGDFFRLTLEGFDGAGASTGILIRDLANYEGPGTGDDFFLEDWLNIDLTSLGTVRSLVLSTSSSQNSDLGLPGMPNVFSDVPSFFAFDNLSFTAVPEPASAALLIAGAMGLALRRRRANQRC